MTDMPKMLKLKEDEDSDVGIYCPICSINALYNEDGQIYAICDLGGGENRCIVSTSGAEYNIASLGCKSNEEFTVALDLYNLVFDPNQIETHINEFKDDQVKKIKNLIHENALLKKKIKDLKKILKD